MKQRGFTLLEVMIALTILAMSLSVLMTAQSSALRNAGLARDVTVASLLARSKMIDVEREIFDEGFTTGEQVEKGDFGDEGYEDFKWEYRLTEVELDLSLMEDMCGASGDDIAADECGAMIGGLGGMVEPLVQRIANAVRMVELSVSWPIGRKSKTGFSIRTILTRDGFTFAGGQPQQTSTQTPDPNDPNSTKGSGNQDPNSLNTLGNTPAGVPLRRF